ncbi:MAG: histidinol dehydrogenase [Synergistaceae bacterium]|nr:histidinol dehydrogenase [Synergistaceae bacterium]
MIRIMRAEEYSRKGTGAASPDVAETVRGILADVKARGDEAVREYEVKFGGTGELEVPEEEIPRSLETVGAEYAGMLSRAAGNIRAFHARQVREGFMFSPEEGVILGQRVIPLKRVGLYVPGGRASYPSTVLMNAIPAKIAGCEEIFIATPNPAPEILAAAKTAGVTRIFRMGGAQAIGAFAYGTESVPRVDKITGPGNSYVAEAKRQVYGAVDIDMTAGPSEILIIAASDNNPSHMAADMLAQAEHDPSASSILITDSPEFARKVAAEIDRQLEALERRETAGASIDANGAILLVDRLIDAAKIADDIAPEHLELCVDDPFTWLTRIRNAGSVFIGRNSPEALGDYYAGANHTLPTMGTARFSSPLSVDDFVRKSQYIYYTADALSKASGDIEMFAMSEGLTGHAASVTVRRG